MSYRQAYDLTDPDNPRPIPDFYFEVGEDVPLTLASLRGETEPEPPEEPAPTDPSTPTDEEDENEEEPA